MRAPEEGGARAWALMTKEWQRLCPKWLLYFLFSPATLRRVFPLIFAHTEMLLPSSTGWVFPFPKG